MVRRVSLAWKPIPELQTLFLWEHFSEDDDRLRSGKQLCETVLPPTSVDGVAVPAASQTGGRAVAALDLNASYFSQGCQPTSLYSPSAFQVPYGPSLPYVLALQSVGAENYGVDPYAETTQSRNLREIQSAILPRYKAKNDILEFNADYQINPALTLTSQTGYNQDFLYSSEDYDRFDTSPGIFVTGSAGDAIPCGSGAPPFCVMDDPAAGTNGIPSNAVIYCDPQLGCSDRLIVQDLDVEHAWQLSSSEFRAASNFGGPFNFSIGANYLHYETEENYYVFSNALTAAAAGSGGGGECCGSYVTKLSGSGKVSYGLSKSKSRRGRRPSYPGLHLLRRQPNRQSGRPGPQLLPEPESLHAEFLRCVW